MFRHFSTLAVVLVAGCAAVACGRIGFEPTSDSAGVATPPGWRAAALRYRRVVTVPADVTTETLERFPVLVAVTDPALSSRVQATGTDVDVVDARTGVRLPFEIASVNLAAGTMALWVRVEALAPGTETRLEVYYGGIASTAAAREVVWAEYEAAWHLEEQGTGRPGEFQDASGNGREGRGGGGAAARVPTAAPGVVGMGQRFDGRDDYIAHPQDLPPGGGTLSHWLKPEGQKAMVFFYEVSAAALDRDGFGSTDLREVHTATFAHGDFVRGNGGTAPRNEYTWFALIQDGVQSGTNSGHVWLMPDVGAPDRWTHVALTWNNAGRARLYVDAVDVYSVDLSRRMFRQYPPVFRAMGRSFDDRADRHWLGMADEVRVTTLERSAAWLQAEVRNQRDPATFAVVGPVETRP